MKWKRIKKKKREHTLHHEKRWNSPKIQIYDYLKLPLVTLFFFFPLFWNISSSFLLFHFSSLLLGEDVVQEMFFFFVFTRETTCFCFFFLFLMIFGKKKCSNPVTESKMVTSPSKSTISFPGNPSNSPLCNCQNVSNKPVFRS